MYDFVNACVFSSMEFQITKLLLVLRYVHHASEHKSRDVNMLKYRVSVVLVS